MQGLNDPWMAMFVMSRKCVNKEDDCILDDRPGTKDEHSYVEVNESASGSSKRSSLPASRFMCL